MKTIRKIAAAASAAAVMTLPAVNVSAAEGGNFGKLFVMGDSVSTGYGLDGYEAGDNYSAKDNFAYKLAESDLFGYSGEESDDYANFSIDGITTADLLEYVTDDDDFRSRITDADQIVISIGGNDFLQPMLAAAMNAMMNDQEFMDQVLEGSIPMEQAATAMYEKYADVLIDTVKNIPVDESNENISEIFETIYQLNQDCDVYILTVYNPFDHDFGDIENAEGIAQFIELSETSLAYMNDGIRTAADEYENVHVIDVYGSFKGKAAELTNIPDGDIHPSKAGHEVIYELLADTIDIYPKEDVDGEPEAAEETDTEETTEEPEEAETAETDTAAEPETPPAPASDSSSDSAPTGNLSAEVLASITAVSFAGVLISRRKHR